MPASQDTIQLVVRLWRHLSQRRRRQFGVLLGLMIFASMAEMLSIGAVVPFLAVLVAPERVLEHAAARTVAQALGITSASELLLPFTAAFAVAALVAGAMRLLLIWASTRISFAAGADLGIDMYRRTLYQPYAAHISRNSSQVISGITGKTNTIASNILVSILTLISSSIMVVAILIVLIVVDPLIALSAFFGIGIIYGIIIRFTRQRLVANSRHVARESTQVLKSLTEGLGGIRDVLIDGSQATYCKIYRNADLPLRRAQGNSLFISQSPRYGIEALGMILIAGLAYVLAQQAHSLANAIPILGVLAVGAQRLLPMVQQSFVAWSTIKGGQASLEDTLLLLDQPLPEYASLPAPKPIPYRQHLRLEKISFRYAADAPWVLQDFDLTIRKGARVGFIGPTGSGKSTLLDIIMGLLEPTRGYLVIDDQVITESNRRAWQAHIAHVPQAIYLADSTVEENIAFGLLKNQIDHERVRRAARQAQIADLVESWPKHYQTMVGERGISLSGGQRQRIGIARALYKEADVIIFDEATSALDGDTERAVMESIEGLGHDLTILIIAHRLSTLKNCTQIIELATSAR